MQVTFAVVKFSLLGHCRSVTFLVFEVCVYFLSITSSTSKTEFWFLTVLKKSKVLDGREVKSKILMDSLQIICPKFDSWLLCSTSSQAVLEKTCV